MTKIVILDECDLTERHLDRLRALGDVKVHKDNPESPSETLLRLSDCEIAILGWTQIDERTLDALPSLRMISVWATGYNYVDVEAARRRGVVVTNVPAYAGTSVAEFCLLVMLSLARPIISAVQSVKTGQAVWKPFLGRELRGQTLGVIGTGDIGLELIRLSRSLGMNVLAFSRTKRADKAVALGFEYTDMGQLLSRSDFVSLHVPLSRDTRHLLGEEQFAVMKPEAFLINTTRADVIDQAALTRALRDGHLGGAALDEINYPDSDLLEYPRVIVTPHIGFYTTEALVRKGDVCVGNIEAYLDGVQCNVVNA